MNKKSIKYILISLFVLANMLVSSPGRDSTATVFAQGVRVYSPNLLSDGQFVYGPNVGDFNVQAYIDATANHLVPYAEEIYRRSVHNSINPKVYLTLIEMATGLVSNHGATTGEIEDPFGLETRGFVDQLDIMSGVLNDAYYLRLYGLYDIPLSEQGLPVLRLTDGTTVEMGQSVNAGTYALVAALSRLKDAQGMEIALADTETAGFFKTYRTLFPGDDPLDEDNQVYRLDELSALSTPAADLLQLPYEIGESWMFNGVHSRSGTSGTDMSSIDFSPGWPEWNEDTSNMWVVAAAGGIPTKVSECEVRVRHTDGWETLYYHLEGIPSFGSSITQNERIGVIANTLPEAICSGGSSTGPHVHFTLRYNGALVPLNGVALSGWYVHSGRWNYDYDPDYMWLEKGGVKKVVGNWLESSVPPDATTFTDVPEIHPYYQDIEILYANGLTAGCSISPPKFCPETILDRAQSAVFMLRGNFGVDYTPPESPWDTFTDDWSKGLWAEKWAEGMYDRGLTAGCSTDPLRFCPWEQLPRTQVAVFGLKLKYGEAYSPPDAAGTIFADVIDPGVWYAKWAEQAYNDGLIPACGTDANSGLPLFCPNQLVDRGFGAYVIVRAKDLPTP